MFQCGRPWVILKCRECDAEIGGTGHNLLPGNTALDLVDSTKKGYLLDCASNTSDIPQYMRELGPAAFHITRFFLHCALYFACDVDEERAVREMMDKFKNLSYSLKEFFWEHLNKDLSLIQKCLHINSEEVFFVIHSLMGKMLSSSEGNKYF